MAWRDDEPELQDMRAMLRRLRNNLSDSQRCAFAEIAVRNVLGMDREPPARRIKVTVISRKKRSFTVSRSPLLLLELRDDLHLDGVFYGTDADVSAILGGQFGTGTVTLAPEQLARLRERYQFGADDLGPPSLQDREYRERGALVGGGGDDGGSGGGGGTGSAAGDNGAGGSVPPAGAGGSSADGASGDGPGGLIEVVSHPVLFSVALEDYRAILENC